jgi:hypothetical protein
MRRFSSLENMLVGLRYVKSREVVCEGWGRRPHAVLGHVMQHDVVPCGVLASEDTSCGATHSLV